MQTIFLVSTPLCFFVVLDEYFLNTHGLCFSGKPLREKKFNKELVGDTMVFYFYYHFLNQFLFVFSLSLFF